MPSNFLHIFPEHEKHSLHEHDELLDALESRDPAAARTIAEKHVLEAGSFLADRLDRPPHEQPA